MKSKLFFSLTAVMLAVSIAGLTTSCSRNLDSSSMNPAESGMPSESTLPESSTPNDLTPSVPSEVMPPDVSLPALSMSADFLKIAGLDSASVKWGPSKLKDARGRSTACIGLQEKYGKYNADFIAPDEMKITMTFDQGYENGFTPAVLDILKEKQVQGIFFITGDYLRTQPQLVQRMIDEGHIVGNHTNKHLNFSNAEPEKAFADVQWVHDKMREDFDYEMRLFRFPEGDFNERSLAMLNQMGYKSVFWSFAYADWDPNNQLTPEDAMTKIKEYIHPGEIMLLHTVGKTNSLILGDLIDYIRESGYEIGPYGEGPGCVTTPKP